MGTKAYKSIILFVALLLLLPLQVSAASVSELYAKYGMDYEVDIPEDVIQTIRSYDGAKKYVSMYNYVVNSEYDVQELTSEMKELDKRIGQLYDELMSCYAADLNRILQLEDEYSACVARRSDLERTLVSYEVQVEKAAADSVPSYSEYVDALRTKNELVATTDIGNLSELSVPAQSMSRLLNSSDDVSTYRVIEGTGVLSLFNGTVEEVYIDDDYGLTVIVDNHNGVKTYFCNLEISDVSVGATVYQNQRIGYVFGSKLQLRLKLGDEFVDISKILAEV